MKIVYEKKDDNWYVYDIDYSADYKYESSYYKWYHELCNYTPPEVFYKEFKILPQDYPPAS